MLGLILLSLITVIVNIGSKYCFTVVTQNKAVCTVLGWNLTSLFATSVSIAQNFTTPITLQTF